MKWKVISSGTPEVGVKLVLSLEEYTVTSPEETFQILAADQKKLEGVIGLYFNKGSQNDLQWVIVPTQQGDIKIPELTLWSSLPGKEPQPIKTEAFDVKVNPTQLQLSQEPAADYYKPVETSIAWMVSGAAVMIGIIVLVLILRFLQKKYQHRFFQGRAKNFWKDAPQQFEKLRRQLKTPQPQWKKIYFELSELLKATISALIETSVKELTTSEILELMGSLRSDLKDEVRIIFSELDRVKYTLSESTEEQSIEMIQRIESLFTVARKEHEKRVELETQKQKEKQKSFFKKKENQK